MHWDHKKYAPCWCVSRNNARFFMNKLHNTSTYYEANSLQHYIYEGAVWSFELWTFENTEVYFYYQRSRIIIIFFIKFIITTAYRIYCWYIFHILYIKTVFSIMVWIYNTWYVMLINSLNEYIHWKFLNYE